MSPDQTVLNTSSDFNSSHQDMANAIRFLSADAVQRANSGHPGMPMGMADVATVLFSHFLKFDADKPKWPDRDRFILSTGHGSMLLYSLLHLTGYSDMPIEELQNFRQLGSKTAGHPEYGHADGIECTTGPLGQGLTMAVGMALGERIMNARFGDALVDHKTYVIAGDGCLMEGVSHEAISMAGHLKLSNLIVLFDDNAISIDGSTEMVVSDDQLTRFQASGWDVAAVEGHDPKSVAAAIQAAQQTDMPSLIACKTVIGRGAPTKEGSSATHGAPLGDDELAAAREKMDWPYAPFEIPDNVVRSWRAVGKKSTGESQKWESRLNASGRRSEFELSAAGALPKDLSVFINTHKKNMSKASAKTATRQASGAVLEVLNAAIPELIGGSADLTGSVNTKIKNAMVISAPDYAGKYIHYGVREFAMAAVMNGLALHGGVIPYGGTFLVFADYLRGALRLSALMSQRVVYVLTHDSIGLGEDGPTHQPVETLASLRAIPNLNVFRPADAIETAECWQIAMESYRKPSVIVLTRQGLATVRTDHTDKNLSAKGGYILADCHGERQATVLATGSEVEVALEAQKTLQAEGVPTAVVSMPSWNLFEEQDSAYKEHVLGSGVRVAIEAAVQMGWDKYIGSEGGFIGMSSFGASAPASELYKHFGITAQALVTAVKNRL
ncbi:MAG TPA: transketolase [Rhodospirillales bacterium]|jgi:transketolase|nr:transketolase [Rhodospirillales bacterium]HIL74382.1 transketolase [Rhodospirillales bacterium]